METYEEDYPLGSRNHESLDQRRDSQSVSFRIRAGCPHPIPHSALALGFPEVKRNLSQEIFNKYGPFPRICFYLANTIMVALTIAFFSIERLRDILDEACNFELDDESLPIFLLRRLGMNNALDATSEPAAHAVENRDATPQNRSDTTMGALDDNVCCKADNWLSVRVLSAVDTPARRYA